jgi:hypothetical protein
MNPAVISAIIAAVTAVLCQRIVNWGAARKRAVEEAKNEQRLKDRLTNIEKKLDEHNGYAEKLGDIAVTLGQIKTDIKYLREATKP